MTAAPSEFWSRVGRSARCGSILSTSAPSARYAISTRTCSEVAEW